MDAYSFDVSHLSAEVKARTTSSAAYIGLAQIAKLAITLISMAAIARLVSPNDHGVVAMAMCVANVLSIAKDGGLSRIVVRSASLTGRQVSSFFWICIFIALALFALNLLLAPLLAWSYHDRRVLIASALIAVRHLVAGAGVMHVSLLKRKMQVSAISFADITAHVLGACITIATGYLTHNYFALIVGDLVWNLATVAWYWAACSWRPSYPANVFADVGVLRSGFQIVSGDVLTFISRNVDNLLVGWVWGPSNLGYYDRAFRLMLSPLSQLGTMFHSVAFPALSRLVNERARYCRAFVSIVGLVGVLTAPFGIMCALESSGIVHLVLGDRWKPVEGLLRGFAGTMILEPILSVATSIFLTMPFEREFFVYSKVSAAATVAGILIALPFGIEAVALGFSITTLVVKVPLFAMLAVRTRCITLKELVGAFVPGAIAMSVAAVADIALRTTGIAWFSRVFVCSCMATAAGSLCLQVVRNALLSAMHRFKH